MFNGGVFFNLQSICVYLWLMVIIDWLLEEILWIYSIRFTLSRDEMARGSSCPETHHQNQLLSFMSCGFKHRKERRSFWTISRAAGVKTGYDRTVVSLLPNCEDLMFESASDLMLSPKADKRCLNALGKISQEPKVLEIPQWLLEQTWTCTRKPCNFSLWFGATTLSIQPANSNKTSYLAKEP